MHGCPVTELVPIDVLGPATAPPHRAERRQRYRRCRLLRYGQALRMAERGNGREE